MDASPRRVWLSGDFYHHRPSPWRALATLKKKLKQPQRRLVYEGMTSRIWLLSDWAKRQSTPRVHRITVEQHRRGRQRLLSRAFEFVEHVGSIAKLDVMQGKIIMQGQVRSKELTPLHWFDLVIRSKIGPIAAVGSHSR